MKKYLFLLLLITITGCMSDDYVENLSQEIPFSKVEEYKVKAKEFAEMYHVHMSLNEDSIYSLIKNKTIDEMEQDFKNLQSMSYIGENSDKPCVSKLGIRRRIIVNDEFNYQSGQYSVYLYAQFREQGTSIDLGGSGEGVVNWHFYSKGGSYIYISFTPVGSLTTISGEISNANITRFNNHYTCDEEKPVTYHTPYYNLVAMTHVIFDTGTGKHTLSIYTNSFL